MIKTITIHEAKTHLSRYVKQAKSGQKIYLGSYGKPEAMLVVADQGALSGKRRLGVWADKPLGYRNEDIVGPDADIIKDFETSINRSLNK